MANYTVEKFKIEDFQKLIPLMKDCFGMDVDVNYFKWKYCENPSGEIIAYMAKNEMGDIVGFECSIPEVYIVNNEQVIFYQSVDSMTHSGYRKQGIFKDLSYACYDEMKLNDVFFVLGFAGKDSMPPMVKFGWSFLFDVDYYFRIPLQCKIRITSPCKSLLKKYQIKNIESLDDVIRINNANYQDCPIRKLFNKESLKWKLSNPRCKYEIKGVFNDNKLIGYLIYYLFNNKIMLFDSAFIKDHKEAEKALFAWLDSVMIENKYQGILTISQGDIYYSKLLKRNGFIRNILPFGPLKDSIPFMIITNKSEEVVYLKEKNWAITPFAHDSF